MWGLVVPILHIAMLQRVQNAAARLLSGTCKYEHISPILASLHWLPIHFRINFIVLLFVFKALYGLAPSYFSEPLHHYTPSHLLRSADQLLLSVPKTKCKVGRGTLLLWKLLKCWMTYHCTSDGRHHYLFLNHFLKLISLPWLLTPREMLILVCAYFIRV